MTRVTNLGRKRTYLEAGFGSTTENSTIQPEGAVEGAVEAPGPDSEPLRKKKRIRKKKSKASSAEVAIAKEEREEDATGGDGDDPGAREDPTKAAGPSKKALKKKKWKEMEKAKKQQRLLSSENRRQKRTQERTAGTTCFACREIGHTARDCPKAKNGSTEDGVDKGRGKSIVGICYRCGSTRHTLSKCKKGIDESNPLPFASCFVCNDKGHLASACPQNADKGIYPNGGCCKLCGEKSHLAKDCDLLKKDNIDIIAVMSSGDQQGADEDDFHTFKRRRQEVETDTKSEDAKKKMLGLRAGAQSHIVKAFGTAPKPAKKVVYF